MATSEKEESKKSVVWEGRAGIRRLSRSDLEKIGIKHDSNLQFYRGQPVLLPAAVADGLAKSKLVPGFKVLG